MADAILRTLFRLFVRRQKLLEWVTAAQSKVTARLGFFDMYLWMSGGVGLAIIAGVMVGWAAPASWLIAAPFIILWILSPAVARLGESPAISSQRESSDGRRCTGAAADRAPNVALF